MHILYVCVEGGGVGCEWVGVGVYGCAVCENVTDVSVYTAVCVWRDSSTERDDMKTVVINKTLVVMEIWVRNQTRPQPSAQTSLRYSGWPLNLHWNMCGFTFLANVFVTD